MIKNFMQAEQACLQSADQVALQLESVLTKHCEKNKSIMRRMSRRASKSTLLPNWTAQIGLIQKDNPGELLPSEMEFNLDKQHLEEWKKLQGLAALCALFGGAAQMLTHGYVRGALVLRRAWQIAKRATDNAEAHADVPNALGLVMGTFQIGLSTVPPWVLTFLRAAGFSGDAVAGKEALERIIKLTDPMGETCNYSKLVLAANGIMMSAQEYRPDRAVQLKRADEILMDVLNKNPDWVLFRWMRSHVLRRLGRIEDAAKIVHELMIQMQPELDGPSYRLPFDLASLQFIQRDWSGAEKLLKPLVTDDSGFTSRGLAYAMLSACAAMKGNVIESVKVLETMEKKLEEEKASGRVDISWLLKVTTLYHRPHKRVLAYELAYLFGYMKWFDSDIAGTVRTGGKLAAQDWLDRTAADLQMMHDEAAVSVVYPEFPVIKEEAAEELVTVSLMCGCVASMRMELDKAERFFKSVFDNNSTKSAKEGTRDDPWHGPFANYELGSLEIKRGNFLAAQIYIVRSLKSCKKKNFSFHHMLSFKCAGALRHISEQVKPTNVSQADWKTHKDELGVWIGDLSGSKESAMQSQGLNPGDMVLVVVTRGEKFELCRPMKHNDTLSWNWALETHDVGFQAFYVTDIKGGGNVKKEDHDEIEPYAKYEAGDFVEGFFTARDQGVLKLVWDNTYSKFTDKKVHYSLNR